MCLGTKETALNFSEILIVCLPLVGLGLDLALKDPYSWPHPVRWLGTGADFLERAGRLLPMPLTVAGALCALLLACCSWSVVGALVALPVLGLVAGCYFAYAGLALGGLLQEGDKVLALLEQGELEQSRRAVGMLVSRDTSSMDEGMVAQSLAETMSENFGDGFVAPYFYLCLLGPAGLWAYKAVSTLDSMWGYKTERFRDFGWAAARLDDALAWIPSRLAAVALYGCGRVLVPEARDVRFSDIVRDARRMESPNAGWPMAAAAWVCRASMGGRVMYFGKWKDKPQLGPEGEAWSPVRLRLLLRLVRVSGVFLAVILWVLVSVLLTVVA